MCSFITLGLDEGHYLIVLLVRLLWSSWLHFHACWIWTLSFFFFSLLFLFVGFSMFICTYAMKQLLTIDVVYCVFWGWENISIEINQKKKNLETTTMWEHGSMMHIFLWYIIKVVVKIRCCHAKWYPSCVIVLRYHNVELSNCRVHFHNYWLEGEEYGQWQ